MQQLIFVYPGDVNTPTGGYAYDRRMIEGLERLRWHVQMISLGEGYPFPNPIQEEYARSVLLHLTKGIPMVIDGLALGALPHLAIDLAKRHPLIALIHHPLAFEFGLSDQEIKSLLQSERLALQHVVQIIANSPSTARDLIQHYDIRPEIINVILPGTDRVTNLESSSKGSAESKNRVHLLSVGSIIPRKGFHYLIAALEPLVDLPWNLTIVGDHSRHIAAYELLMTDIKCFHLENRVQVLGTVSKQNLDYLYTHSDVFVLASLFEGYGMVYAEAMAYGLPIIATTGGAIPDTVPKEAGLLVPPADIPALTAALKTLIQDPLYRARLSRGALQAASQQPTWEYAVQQFITVLARLTLPSA